MTFRTLSSKALIILLIVSMLAPVVPVATPRAQAQFTVNVNSIIDPGWIAFAEYMAAAKTQELNWEMVLKGIGWAVAKTAIKSMTRSIVDWINSGFDGSPAFTQNLNNDLRRLADGVAVGLVSDLLSDASIQSPYLQQAVQGAVTGYLIYTSRERIAQRLAYTLSEYTQYNPERWGRGDFSSGGWGAWFASVRICGNNAYCARFATEEELVNRIDSELRQRLEELSWGEGFMSWRGECVKPAGEASLGDAETCYQYAVQTPGSVIESTLGITATSPLRQLEIADSIDEIVSALVSQLVTQIVGSTGLFGVSQPSQGGGRPILHDATDTSGSANPGLTSDFDQIIEIARGHIDRFIAAWETILGEAQSAHSLCQSRPNRTTETARLQAIIDQGTAALARANQATAELDILEDRVEAIRTDTEADNQPMPSVERLTGDYQCLLRGGVPSPEEEDPACLQTDDGLPLMPDDGDATEMERQTRDEDGTLHQEIEELRTTCSRLF